MVERVFCTSCGAECQLFSAGWRCPWATESRRGTAWVDGSLVLVCDQPYERSREVLHTVREARK